MNATHCPPARLAALTNLTDLLTRIEWAADPDDALKMCGEFPVLIRALVEVLGDEGAKAYTVGVDHGLGTDRAVATVWDVSANPPERVPTNCDSCRYDFRDGGNYLCAALHQGDRELEEAIEEWIADDDNVAADGSPTPTATGCPGWKWRTPEETAEDVARRLGLHVAEYSKDHRYGSVVWQNRGGTWEAETSSATYPDALSALHAYAASVGK